MKSAFTRRFRRRSATTKSDGAFFKKESLQDQNFFGEPAHSSFFQPTVTNASSSGLNRKCADCENEDKVQRVEEKKEEENKVMRVEEKKEEEKVQREPEKKEEEKLMKAEDKKEEEDKVQKKEAGSVSGKARPVSNYIGSLNGKGQPLPSKANHFFSSRMGFDFSGVKIHNDKAAAESAKRINAKAYAVGNNIVFNEGQYNTESAEGKKLMAHELAHVVQTNAKKLPGDQTMLQRAITYSAAAERREDPIPKVLSSTRSTLGKTFPVFNGTVVKTTDDAIKILGPIFIDNITLQYDKKKKKCKVNVKDIKLDVSADVQKLTVPDPIWTGSYAGSLVRNCEKHTAVNIEMDSSPSGAAAFEQRIADDEKEHVDDLKKVAKKHFDAFYTYLSNISLSSKDGSDCAALYVTEIGTKDADMIKAFIADWLAAVDVHDKASGNHHHSTVTDNRNCNLVKITANF